MPISDIAKLESRMKTALSAQIHNAPVRSFNVLGTISRLMAAGCPLTQAVISDHSGSNRSSVSEEIRRLERMGYLSIEDDPEDRRALILKITPEGGQFLLFAQQASAKAFDKLFAKLTAPERNVFIELLAKAVAD
jgi:DNA-binding MarR family transcriptional regulator